MRWFGRLATPRRNESERGERKDPGEDAIDVHGRDPSHLVASDHEGADGLAREPEAGARPLAAAAIGSPSSAAATSARDLGGGNDRDAVPLVGLRRPSGR